MYSSDPNVMEQCRKVEDHQRFMASQNNKIKSLEADKSKLEADKSKLEADKSKLEADNSKLTADNNNLAAENSNLLNKIALLTAELDKARHSV
jgi:peptidoglycan hydrolase CwlO-like protein